MAIRNSIWSHICARAPRNLLTRKDYRTAESVLSKLLVNSKKPLDSKFGDRVGNIVIDGRKGVGIGWTGLFPAVYVQGDREQGIGWWYLKSPADRAFAFDFDRSGKIDHVALYRPGTGTFCILKNIDGAFSAVYCQGDPGYGIGRYDIRSSADRASAFDFDHSGKLDHIALYRPGTGTFWILKNVDGAFSAVYSQGDPGHGIGGYDMRSSADRAFAFDSIIAESSTISLSIVPAPANFGSLRMLMGYSRQYIAKRILVAELEYMI